MNTLLILALVAIVSAVVVGLASYGAAGVFTLMAVVVINVLTVAVTGDLAYELIWLNVLLYLAVFTGILFCTTSQEVPFSETRTEHIQRLQRIIEQSRNAEETRMYQTALVALVNAE